MSDLLWQLLAKHRDLNPLCDRLCSCGIQHPIGHVYHLNELITAEFLVVPHTDISGTEYGYRYRGDDQVYGGGTSRQRALRLSTHPDIFGLQRPVLPWSRLPDRTCDGCGSAESRCLTASFTRAIKCCPDCDHQEVSDGR